MKSSSYGVILAVSLAPSLSACDDKRAPSVTPAPSSSASVVSVTSAAPAAPLPANALMGTVLETMESGG